MLITKERLGNGLAQYIKTHIVPAVPDTWSKRVMAGIADLVIIKPDTIYRITERYPIFEMLEDDDGKYDIDVLEQIVKKNISEYGEICIDVMGGEYRFNVRDIDALMSMLR